MTTQAQTKKRPTSLTAFECSQCRGRYETDATGIAAQKMVGEAGWRIEWWENRKARSLLQNAEMQHEIWQS